MQALMFILYVRDQRRSAEFYRAVLEAEPTLDVPGMTEFALAGGGLLGLMPNEGAARLLGDRVPSPSLGDGIPRAEIYLPVADPSAALGRAVRAGAVALSSEQERGWGDRVAYAADPDGHVLAFAAPSREPTAPESV